MELGKLTAVFDADLSKLNAGFHAAEGKVAGFGGRLSKTTNEIERLTGRTIPGSTALNGLSSSLGLVAGAAVIGAAAIGGVVSGLAELITSSAKAGGELFDLSQKTGFAVETLSGLSIVAKTTGADIQSISGSLIIFQKNMDAASNSTSKQGKLFQSLNVDIHDNEKALRQVFTALGKMGDGTRQTALATQFFGRSGAAVLAMIKETNGNLDEAIKKYDKMGLIISTSAATASDKFNDVLEETTMQLSAVTRSIGMELLPVATDTLRQISFWLSQNKDAWSSWGTSIANTISGVKAILESEVVSMLVTLGRLAAGVAFAAANDIGASQRPGEDVYGPGGVMRGGRGSLPGTPEYMAAQRRLAGLAGAGLTRGGGGGGGGRGGSARTDPAVQLLKQLEDQFKALTPRTEAQIAAERLLSKEFDKTSDAVKKKILITAMDIDTQRMILSITRERVVGLKAETEALEKMIETVREAGASGLPFFSRPRTTNDLTGLLGTGATRERSVAAGATRPRIATVEQQVMRERMQMVREQMTNLASDLTSLFSRSLYDGISGGGRRGLQSLSLGFLEMIQDVVLGKLKSALAEALAGGASGGGLLGKLLGIFIPALAGGLGGIGGGAVGGLKGGLSAGFGGKFASGGYLAPGQWGIAGENGPERIYGGQTGMTVVPSGPVVNNYNIQLPPTPRGGYSSPKSQRQLAAQVVSALQGAQA